MLVVAALGGNALLRRGEEPRIAVQRRNLAAAGAALAEIAREDALVVTHGNGPQIGQLALRAGSDETLDVLGAESEGLIGYLIEEELSRRLPGRDVAALLTRVGVDPRDPAFAQPTKPIGPVYRPEEAQELARARGWTMMRDGDGMRRAVPSPEPRSIVEQRAIRLLVDSGAVVICAGGGGIPVVRDESGMRGVEAVIDKDLAAALLARELAADALLLLTDVRAIYDDWPHPARRPITEATPGQLRARRFAAGSMAPKVEAACRFVEATGGRAAIGSLADAARMLRGDAGTIVVRDAAPASIRRR
jgi:carbamate kinase